MDFPNVHLPPLPTITPFSEESLGHSLTGIITVGVSTAVVANVAHFFPFHLEMEAVAKKLYWLNGATVAGNIDAGIYDSEWNYVVGTTPTAQSGTTAMQVTDITDITLPPGYYSLAIAVSDATATLLRSGNNDEILFSQVALYVQTGLTSGTLPTTVATPAKPTTTVANVYTVGVSFDDLL